MVERSRDHDDDQSDNDANSFVKTRALGIPTFDEGMTGCHRSFVDYEFIELSKMHHRFFFCCCFQISDLKIKHFIRLGRELV